MMPKHATLFTKVVRVWFPQRRGTKESPMKLILAVMAMAALVVGCKSEEGLPADFHNAPPLGGDIGKTIGRLTRDYMALDRMSMQSGLRISTQDNHQNHYVAALADPTSKSKGSQRNPLLVHQVFRLTLATPQPKTNLTPFADGFEQITAMLWHEGALHLSHGPHYSVIQAAHGPAAGDRVEVSHIDRKRGRRPAPSIADAPTLMAILADRTKPNEARIDALWKLRAIPLELANPRQQSAQMLTPDLDPTKAFITALHNGPDALRAEAAKVLRVSPKDVRPAIKGLIHRAKNDTNAKVRMEAALTLGHHKASEAVAELFGSLDDPDDHARMAKILAIRRINEWELAPAFVNAAAMRTREGAMLALTDLHEPGVIDALIFTVRAGAYPEIRLRAVDLLERAMHRTQIDDWDVFIHSSSSNPQTRDAIPFERPKWIPRTSVSPQSQQILAALGEAANDDDESVRTAAKAALQRLAAAKK